MSRLHPLPMSIRRGGLALAAVSGMALLLAAMLLQPPGEGTADRAARGSAVEQPAAGAAAGPETLAIAPPVAEPTDAHGREAGAAGSSTTPGIADRAGASRISVPSLAERIVRTGSIQLRVRRGAFEDAWSQARAAAAAAGGSVVTAHRTGSGPGRSSGTLTLRVPSGRFDATVDRIRGIDRARVLRLDVSSQDVTEEFVDVRSRLRHDRAVEGRLLALLAQADGVSEVLAVQARLDQVQEQVEVARGRLQYLEQVTSFSTVTVELRERRVAPDADRDGGVLAGAWEDARARFAATVAGAIVWAGGALPALLLLAVTGIVVHRIRRRRGGRAGSAS